MKEQKWIQEGLITESPPNGMFRIRLDNDDLILGYVSGKIRRSFIRILPGDRVKVEVSRYDSTRGRIIFDSVTRIRRIKWFEHPFRGKTNRDEKLSRNLLSSKK
uniref:Translation initiation factor IF-1, chloroplastic n=1 Tax=Cyrtophyllum fragrans TaxID=84942 RepID=A0A890CEG5_9GENT|nr:translation initiation factor 1 [Cyrtophyllum fragrans]QRG30307.1 translation initiation factor 1 [Cyrtophyllum fragrans]